MLLHRLIHPAPSRGVGVRG